MFNHHQGVSFVPTPANLRRTKKGLSSGLNHVCARRDSSVSTSRTINKRSELQMGLFGLGLPELAVIAGVGIFIFGPSKIAELGKDLGGLAGGLKKASSEFRDAMQESMDEADRELEQKRVSKSSAADTSASSTVETRQEKAEA
ncbi:unnamed protein product [Agarophyton chilense]